MTNKNRSAVFGKLQRVLKKAFKTPEFPDRTLMEHLLFACLLENTHYDIAERSFKGLLKNFYDLNEIRVSSIKELAEILHLLPEPESAARRLRGALQHVFESLYKFDLEHLKKQNIGVAEKTLREIRGISPFVVDYVVQAGLGGHAIPLDQGALTALYVVGAISGGERDEGKATGLARAIPKAKGMEFAHGLHELGAEFVSHPHSPHVRELALSIDADCKDRFPKKSPKLEELSESASTKKPQELEKTAGSKSAKSEPPASGSAKTTAAPKDQKKGDEQSKGEAKPSAAPGGNAKTDSPKETASGVKSKTAAGSGDTSTKVDSASPHAMAKPGHADKAAGHKESSTKSSQGEVQSKKAEGPRPETASANKSTAHPKHREEIKSTPQKGAESKKGKHEEKSAGGKGTASSTKPSSGKTASANHSAPSKDGKSGEAKGGDMPTSDDKSLSAKKEGRKESTNQGKLSSKAASLPVKSQSEQKEKRKPR